MLDMAKKKTTARKPFKADPQADVVYWARRIEAKKAVSRTIVATAGLVALKFASEQELESLLQWAGLLNDEHIQWAELEAVVKLRQEQREAALRKALEAAILETKQGRSADARESRSVGA